MLLLIRNELCRALFRSAPSGYRAGDDPCHRDDGGVRTAGSGCRFTDFDGALGLGIETAAHLDPVPAGI